MKETLLIVDPQNDFITGSLPVPRAAEAMDRLSRALGKGHWERICVTMDCHTTDHCSFTTQGGIWPEHCVKYSVGAAIYPPLMAALVSSRIPISFIEKGTAQDKDEYSAFEKGIDPTLSEADVVTVAGIAGDVCVATTTRDLIRHGLKGRLRLITDCCPSLDGGETLFNLIRAQQIETIQSTELNQE